MVCAVLQQEAKMFTAIINSKHVDLPEPIADKLMGKEIEFLETKEGILLKPLAVSIKSMRGILKGSKVSTERYSRLKQEEKELER
jgi:hypothetical protein